MSGGGNDVAPGEFLLRLIRNPPQQPRHQPPPPQQHHPQIINHYPAVAAVDPTVGGAATFSPAYQNSNHHLHHVNYSNSNIRPHFAPHNFFLQNPNPSLMVSSSPPRPNFYQIQAYTQQLGGDNVVKLGSLSNSRHVQSDMMFGSFDVRNNAGGWVSNLNGNLGHRVPNGLDVEFQNSFGMNLNNGVGVDNRSGGGGSRWGPMPVRRPPPLPPGFNNDRSGKNKSGGFKKNVSKGKGKTGEMNYGNVNSVQMVSGERRLSGQLDNPGLPAGSKVHSANASDIEESQMVLRSEVRADQVKREEDDDDVRRPPPLPPGFNNDRSGKNKSGGFKKNVSKGKGKTGEMNYGNVNSVQMVSGERRLSGQLDNPGFPAGSKVHSANASDIEESQMVLRSEVRADQVKREEDDDDVRRPPPLPPGFNNDRSGKNKSGGFKKNVSKGKGKTGEMNYGNVNSVQMVSGERRLSGQLDNPGLPAGSKVHSANASDIEESQMVLRSEVRADQVKREEDDDDVRRPPPLPPGFNNDRSGKNKSGGFKKNVSNGKGKTGEMNYGNVNSVQMVSGERRLSGQLDNPGLPAGSKVHSANASDIEESQMVLHSEVRADQVKRQEDDDDVKGELVELEGIVDALVLEDEFADKEDKKKQKVKRDKDYRSDKRGQQILNQRMRISRRRIECRRDIHRMNIPFLEIYKSLIPSEEEKAKQKQLTALLEKHVNKEWPEARLYLYGSSANSFGLKKSDIDVCLAIDDTDVNKSEVLLKLADILQADNLQNVQALTSARVPIVKLMDPVTGISCDICVNNLLAVINTKLLRDYALIDERLRQLAFIIKHWAKSRGVNETYKGTPSSYAYVLMCINFLQQRNPAILPCLQRMERTYAANVDNAECAYFDQVEKLVGFGSQNRETIAQLVWEFFSYWAYYHDYINEVISVREGSTVSKHEKDWTRRVRKDWTRRVSNDRHLICIEDPFEISHDLGRVVDKYSIRVLREEFEHAAEIMQYDPDPWVTLFQPYIPS